MERLTMVGYSRDRTRILLSGEEPDSPMFWASADALLDALTGAGVVPSPERVVHPRPEARLRPTPVRPTSPPPPAVTAPAPMVVPVPPAAIVPPQELPTGEVPVVDGDVYDYTAELFEAWAGFVKRTPSDERPSRRSA